MRILRFEQLNESAISAKGKFTEDEIKDLFLNVSDIIGKEPEVKTSFLINHEEDDYWTRRDNLNIGPGRNDISIDELDKYDIKILTKLSFSTHSDKEHDRRTYNSNFIGTSPEKIDKIADIFSEMKRTLAKIEKEEGMECKVNMSEFSNEGIEFAVYILQDNEDYLSTEIEKLKNIDARLKPIINEIKPDTKTANKYFSFDTKSDGSIIIKLRGWRVSGRYYMPFLRKITAAVAKNPNLEMTHNLRADINATNTRYYRDSDYNNYHENGAIKISVKES